MRSDVIDFIVGSIDSVEQLEVLLLLRQNRSKKWTADQVNEIVRSSERSITNHLEKFGSLGLISNEAGTDLFFYSADPEQDQLLEKVAAFYRDRRAAVIEYIYSKPIREIQSFSAAFKFRRKE